MKKHSSKKATKGRTGYRTPSAFLNKKIEKIKNLKSKTRKRRVK